jgi:hypothetical protein
MRVIIYHNPECGTSRNTPGLIGNAGIEPAVEGSPQAVHLSNGHLRPHPARLSDHPAPHHCPQFITPVTPQGE